METKQMDFWNGNFGKEYTDRNRTTQEEFDRIYLEQFGTTRSEMNRAFLNGLEISSILEVGCNVGDQLRNLQSLGYTGLFGIELQSYAAEKAKENCKGINIVQGSGFETPFKDSYFDLVFTNGVLIHIAPEDINRIIDEMYRVSKRFIWGFEYFADNYTPLEYRGEQHRMWKGNFAKLFLDRHPDLKIVKEVKYKHLGSENVDQMYLLEKNQK